MSIEKEIKQKAFASEYHKLVINLLFTANWIRSREHRLLRIFSISPQQYNVLRILKGQHPKPSSLILIRERMLDKDSNASRLVDKLCEGGYTHRIQCSKDRRQVDISITTKGIDLLDNLRPEVDKLHAQLSHIGEEDAKTFNRLLDKLRETEDG